MPAAAEAPAPAKKPAAAKAAPTRANPAPSATATAPKRKNPKQKRGAKPTKANPKAAAATVVSSPADGKRPIPTVESMRAPMRTDAALEAEFKKTFDERIDWGETAVKVVLMDEEWSVERHPASGEIVRRTFSVDIAGKKADGSIMVYSFTMQQEHLGGGKYGTTMRSAHTALGYIDEANL